MPYILQKRRLPVRLGSPENAGELNYKLTMIVLDYIDQKGLCYQTLNDAVGALECAKLELARRIIAPYEDMKCRVNGDVYET